jgi:hypothetical protein
MFINEKIYEEYFSLSNGDKEELIQITTNNIEEFMSKMMINCDMTRIEVLTTVLVSLQQVRETGLNNEQYEKVDLIDKVKDKLLKNASTREKNG